MSRRLTSEEFIHKSILKHGTKYDYSLVNYINNSSKVQIKCSVHGHFLQRPYHHMMGIGCPHCSSTEKLTTCRFIELSNKIHKHKYSYGNCIYINSETDVYITCKIHGDFKQNPRNHYNGFGCSKCSIKHNYNTNEFVELANKIHKNKYLYLKTDYISSKNKVLITCKLHGDFNQLSASHLRGNGCPRCKHIVSNKETAFLNFLNIKLRNIRLSKWPEKPVDGYELGSNTVYEFLGDYWHGNPKVYNPAADNKRAKKTYGQLYIDTISMLTKLKTLGYNVKYIWESDWDLFSKKLIKYPIILNF